MINYWFPIGIYHTFYSEQESLKQFVLSQIDHNHVNEYELEQHKRWPYWQKFHKTSSTKNLMDVEDNQLKKLYNWIESETNIFAKDFNSNDTYTVNQCWMNVYEKGEFQEPHFHLGFDFSAIYYVSVPKNSGNLVFENPLLATEMRPIKTDIETKLNSTAAVYEPKEGLLIIFRSNLRHGVYPHNNELPRISLAFNLLSK